MKIKSYRSGDDDGIVIHEIYASDNLGKNYGKILTKIKSKLKMKELKLNGVTSCMNNRVNSPRIQYIGAEFVCCVKCGASGILLGLTTLQSLII